MMIGLGIVSEQQGKLQPVFPFRTLAFGAAIIFVLLAFGAARR